MKIKKPLELPDCKIINTLIDKSNQKKDYEFDYIHYLNSFRDLVSIEVSRINILFPEYTPHDEKYHLKRLFHVADQLLGDQLIEQMNVTELFLLSVSLYGHDWGMSVSENEKKYITEGCNEESIYKKTTLDNEREKFKNFCIEKNIDKDISLYDWQEYVRITHAFRSGKRVQNFFESISPGIADYAARICEGHWLNFELIDDHTLYPTNAPINLDTVNIKAITIYVRLIDLLDLGDDRTPYILWKFITPKNKFSKIEWEKHRALRPVTFPNYQLGRYIQIDGSTDDHNVFFSIMDLKNYIDNQFRQCLDSLNRINHPYHKLNITHTDWRIAARGFEPTLIQFQFERERMFDILSDQIYQGNPYVFIRELLQNSIDAIKMRVEILNKQDITFKPKIEVYVEETEKQYIVEISDNGIGMDEYIIRNYLSIAGKSYYQSKDFFKEELNMDAISKFGIGVLSCFMVSDYIEIKTFRDPNFSVNQENLKILIPAKENYFRIEKNKETLPVGTSFKIYVEKNKLPIDKKTKKTISLDITNYIKYSIAFLNFPIYISENGNNTIFIHSDITDYNKSYQISKTNYSYPIETAFKPQHIETVKTYFRQETISIKNDLKLDNYDGYITYLIPTIESLDIINNGHSWPISDVLLIDYNDEKFNQKKIKWNSSWVRYDRLYYEDKEVYDLKETSFKVFLNGILVPNITPPLINQKHKHEYYHFETFSVPYLLINITNPNGIKIDIARTNIDSSQKWDRAIWEALYIYIKKNYACEISSKSLKERLLSYSKLTTFYKLSSLTIINKIVEESKFPIPTIINGNLTLEEFDPENFETIRLLPEFSSDTVEFIKSLYIKGENYTGIFNYYKGDKIVCSTSHHHDKTPTSIINLFELINTFIKQKFYFHSIEFILSHKKKPSILRVYKLKTKKEESLENIELKNILDLNLETLNEKKLVDIYNFLKKKFKYFPKITPFPTPFEQKFSYGLYYINSKHKYTNTLVKICLILHINKSKLSGEKYGYLIDLLNDLPFFDYSYDNIYKYEDLNKKTNIILKELSIYITSLNLTELNLSSRDFIKGTINKLDKERFTEKRSNKRQLTTEEWGKKYQ